MAEAAQMVSHQSYAATTNKWFADIPLDIISSDFKKVRIQLQDFTIPRIEVGHTTMKFRNVDISVPNRTFNSSGKEVEFKYLIDENWESYLALYQWANCYQSIDNPTPNDAVIQNDNPNAWWVIPIHVHLLNPFRGEVMHIVYNACTLKFLNELHVSYTDKPVPVPHSFRITYQTVVIGHNDPSQNTAKGGSY